MSKTYEFETHPDRYRHWKLSVDGPVATLAMAIEEDNGLRPDDYKLKLNSYDLGVDIELADAVQRLRFEHPEVSAVILTSALDGVFCSGANIFMLGTESHGFKVNFCKFTNETRLSIEDATQHSGQTYIAALNGIASGGGYELALACEKIYLVDDRRSSVALPEVPYLGVLPGTGGLTRVVDKRMIRRDHADYFCTIAEGVKGKKAQQWNFVDEVIPPSKFDDRIAELSKEIAGAGHPDRKGVALAPLDPQTSEAGTEYEYVSLTLDDVPRVASVTLRVPEAKSAVDHDSSYFMLKAFRELDDAFLRLRFNHPEVGLVLLRAEGKAEDALAWDKALVDASKDDWFAHEVLHFIKRVLKRVELSAKSLFAIVDQGSCFVGTFLELALASDRSYMLDEDGVDVRLSESNFGAFPMANGLSRIETRLLADRSRATALRERIGEVFGGEVAEEATLVTLAFDDLDWEDEIRVAIEERASLSPDALTGMEASLRFAGPETLETKIFGRLSAWQNWIFQRPNAVGEKGALTLYGRPERPEFDWRRT